MAKDKDSVIFYQQQTDKCRKYMTAEQFGRLMMALLDFAKGEEPEVDDDIVLAFEFMSLQQKIDREKYEKRCEKNRENGRKGGRPKKEEKTQENPKKANGLFKNPNENDNENENDKRMMNENDKTHDDIHSFGTFQNVELSDSEREALRRTYERTDELIDKVSVWLRGASNKVSDHYGLCLKFATNDEWPLRKIIDPVELYEPEDPLTEEEQREKVADMRARLNGAFSAG